MCMGQRVKGRYPFSGNNCFHPHISVSLFPGPQALRHLGNKLLSVTCLPATSQLEKSLSPPISQPCLSVLSFWDLLPLPSCLSGLLSFRPFVSLFSCLSVSFCLSTFLSLSPPISQTFCLSALLSLFFYLSGPFYIGSPVSQGIPVTLPSGNRVCLGPMISAWSVVMTHTGFHPPLLNPFFWQKNPCLCTIGQ